MLNKSQLILKFQLIENLVLKPETLTEDEKKIKDGDGPLIKKLKKLTYKPQMIDKSTQTTPITKSVSTQTERIERKNKTKQEFVEENWQMNDRLENFIEINPIVNYIKF